MKFVPLQLAAIQLWSVEVEWTVGKNIPDTNIQLI
jgi:hypothetical protein